jgi:FkbM family methyltransferase
VVDALARAAFALPVLAPVPGWKFGGWNDKDARAHLRHRLWWWAHERGYDGPVTTSWYFGVRFNHHLAGDASFCTYVDGRYEPNEMSAIARLLRPGMCFVDVGANEGLFTLLAAALVGSNGAVHAFEPSPRERARLEENLSLNRFTNVRVHPSALGSAHRKASLSVSGPEHPGHNTLGGFAYPEGEGAYTLDVDVQTLDEVVAGEGLERVDMVKIDVEGFETAVLGGAHDTLRIHRPVLLIEAYDPSLREAGSSVDELLRLLRDAGYVVSEFGASGTPEPLAGDVPRSTNVLCLPRAWPLRPEAASR